MHLTVITGPMYSGKSLELIRRCTIYETIAPVKAYLPEIVRDDQIVSRQGATYPARRIKSVQEIIEELAGQTETPVIAIDEFHFFSFEDARVLYNILYLEKGLNIIVSGLNLDYLGIPFESIAYLLSFADEIVTLTATCNKCGKPATYSVRIDGLTSNPVYLEDVRYVVREETRYEARCPECFRTEVFLPRKEYKDVDLVY